jgi:PIN domain nuclease of toxin-antitoxin system
VSDPLLLDTHVLIWTILASRKISGLAKRALSRPSASLFVSIVSVWEIVIKHQTGRLRFNESLDQILDQVLYQSPWTILHVTSEHLPVLAALPPLHKDPFDRLLIAQAQYEKLTIITADQHIPKYSVRTLW